MDSVKNFSEVGHVGRKDKGIQAFVDGHPVAGKNFYKLTILFNSGLSWTSNHCRVYVDKSAIEKQTIFLPINDSLQKFIVTENISNVVKTDTITTSIIRNENSKMKNITGTKDSIQKIKTVVNEPKHDLQKANANTDTAVKQNLKLKTTVTFELDSENVATETFTGNGNVLPQRKKITVKFEDPSETSATFIRSRFIFIDSESGHIDMFLPDDVKTHHYSVKFYDGKGHVVIDLPKINMPKLIIDKRNFQHSGVYKFILRKDVTELESGYIEIQ